MYSIDSHKISLITKTGWAIAGQTYVEPAAHRGKTTEARSKFCSSAKQRAADRGPTAYIHHKPSLSGPLLCLPLSAEMEARTYSCAYCEAFFNISGLPDIDITMIGCMQFLRYWNKLIIQQQELQVIVESQPHRAVSFVAELSTGSSIVKTASNQPM